MFRLHEKRPTSAVFLPSDLPPMSASDFPGCAGLVVVVTNECTKNY